MVMQLMTSLHKRFSIQRFFEIELASSFVLITAAALALIITNSPWAHFLHSFLESTITAGFGEGIYVLHKSVEWWINDGLMAVFFFLIGLEVKRELVHGELSTPAKASLPTIAAIGGMVVPALIYAWFNYQDPTQLRGWAIPAATDIAFALGVLMFLGDRVPKPLRIFLLALAIIDDLGAILIIAIYFAHGLALGWLGIGVAFILAILALNRLGVQAIWIYLTLSVCVWFVIIQSGIHSTIAGVICAFCLPMRPDPKTNISVSETLENALHIPVGFVIMPLFALANAGVSLSGLTSDNLVGAVPMGIILGLLVGKPIGVFGISWIAIKLKICKLPRDVNWSLLFGVSILTGIGFTMSLFIGNLAFATDDYTSSLRVGVLTGSCLSAVVGFVFMRYVGLRNLSSKKTA